MMVILIFVFLLFGVWLIYFFLYYVKFIFVCVFSLFMLLFYCVLYLLGVVLDMWVVVFFGGSFVGMSVFY